ncbi:MAG: SRPBCC domain-containing protein [Lentimicrobiaceae bacterium]|jgi:uncharacterized protein YndB with AHSA1/START domain
MDKNLKLTTSIDLNVSIDKVWFALTDKELIKQYFWGTEVNSDWNEGSPISYSGTWEGTAYEDKGFILKIEKNKTLKHSYWSSFWGTEFNPHDVSIITYELSANGEMTTLTVTQEGFKDLQSRDHSIENWNGIFTNIKNLLEK